ncbi:MAG TPA: V-type ATPase subunit [Verrucomicrobiae bacterium]|nr:V-type ATPase subunit [Verrucomicrobiae bacterium]
MTQPILYSRVSAKIGAERGKLLSEAKLKTLMESKNLSELATQLRDTSYQEQIIKVSLPFTSRKLERAFHENLISTYVKIIENSPKNASEYLRLYLLRFEVENIKTLIKATNAELSLDQKINRVYLSAEDYLKNRSVIEETAKAPDIKQIVKALKKTDYTPALNMGLQSYEEDGTTNCLDVLLDKTFYEKLHDSYETLPKKEKPHAYFYASIEIDSFTLLTLLRGKNLNYDANWLRLTVPPNNFYLGMETVEAMITATDFESALKIALDSHYAGFFAKAQSPAEIIANAEKAFKKAVFQHAKASIVPEHFNIGVPLAFLTQKEAEVYNLTALSSCKEASIKPDDLQLQLLL